MNTEISSLAIFQSPNNGRAPVFLSALVITFLSMLASTLAHGVSLSDMPDLDEIQKTVKTDSNRGQITEIDQSKSSLSKSRDDTFKLGGFVNTALLQGKSSGLTERSTPFVKFKEGSSVQVYIELVETQDHLIQELVDNGVTVEVINTQLRKVQGWIEADKIDAITSLENVKKITAPNYGTPLSGSVNTVGGNILKSNAVRNLGLTGKGVRVGILSDGASNWKQSSASGDLPEELTIYGTCSKGIDDPQNCRLAGTCNEGTAMAEIVHDLAPDAEIAVAAVSTSLEFIQRLDQLANDFRANIIVDDLGFFGEPFFEDGDIALAITALPARILYISSAGNSANIHYSASRFSGESCNCEQERLHEWVSDGVFSNPAQELYHGFLIPPKSGVFVIMQWDGRSTGGNVTSADFGLHIFSQTRFEGTSDIENQARGQFIEGFCAYNPSSSSAVRFAALNLNRSGSGPNASTEFKMYFLGAQAIEHPKPKGSVFGHPAVERVLAIGTINASEVGNDDIAFYSANGPSFFNVVKPGYPWEVESFPRRKPDLVGIDGVEVTGVGGFPSPFFGTSAAAPHVAGIAAQLMGVSPLVKAKDVSNALTQGAVDLGAIGRDNVYGFGRVDAEKALAKLTFGNPIPAIYLLLSRDE